MSSLQQVDLSLNASTGSSNPVPLFSMGEYSFHAMEVCSEDQIASLFVKVVQRGNPVLERRPYADLELLGRAMYRKTMLLRMGLVVMHKGKPVALSCNWDVAEGGVWLGSGLTVPSSLRAHAAIGEAAFASLPERSGSTFFTGFYGVLAPHPGGFWGILGFASLMLAEKCGFQHTFQYTLLPTLVKRGVFGGSQQDEGTWLMKFADVPTSDVTVSTELKELGGTVNCALMTLAYATGPVYLTAALSTLRIKNLDELLVPCREIALQHSKCLDRNQTATTSRL